MSILSLMDDSDRTRKRAAPASLAVASTALLAAGFALGGVVPAHAAEAEVGLGTAESYAVLAGSAVTNTGPSSITGDLGLSPGSAVTGFPPGVVVGEVHASDAVAIAAQNDATTAYNDAEGRPNPPGNDLTGQDLGGMTLTEGVYSYSTSAQLTGDLTLNAAGDPNAVFIIQAGATLTTASNSTVNLINGASPCNVYWQVGSSATLGTTTEFVGTVLALTSVSLSTGANVEGRVIARNGAVTLDTNVITAPNCAPGATPTAPVATPTAPAATPSATPTDTPTDGVSTPDVPSETPTGTPTPPTIPSGHPETGVSGAGAPERGVSTWLLGGGLLAALAALGLAAAPASRRH